MTEQDLIKLKEALSVIHRLDILDRHDIAIHSPWNPQIEAFVEIMNVDPKVIDRDEWDITQENKEVYDLLFFSNVFMYIDDLSVAFWNVLNSCRYLLLQDLIIRDRSENILGTDGDSMRFSYGELRSNYDKAFDLMLPFEDKILFFIPYIDDGQHVHFITLIKGNAA